MHSPPVALGCAGADFIILCCWQDLLVLNKLNKTVDSSDMAMPLTTRPRLPRVNSMNRNNYFCMRVKENNQGLVFDPVDTLSSNTVIETSFPGSHDCSGFERHLYTTKTLDRRGKLDLMLHLENKNNLTDESIRNSVQRHFIRGQAWESKVST